MDEPCDPLYGPPARTQGETEGKTQGESLADLGEWELIRRLAAFAPPGQFADDAALLNEPHPQQGALVVNTDVLVEGLHFSETTTGPADVGWRAAAANFSDLAAMGCTCHDWHVTPDRSFAAQLTASAVGFWHPHMF